MSETVEDGLAQPRRGWAMLAVALAVTMAVLDGTISNVALPTIGKALHASPISTIWVANGFQIAITVSLLPLASLGEILGYERVYRGGVALFVASSLACALSPSLPVLVAARVAQGLSAAGILAVNGAMIRFIYPRHLLGRGIGLNAMVVAGASVIGPTIGAFILSLANWPCLFAVNVPVGVAALLVGMRALPDTPRSAREFDWTSAVLSALAIGLLVSAIGGMEGTLGPRARIAALLAAAACGNGLVRRQAGQAAPLLPVDLLRIPIFGLSVITSMTAFASQGLSFVALPFYLDVSLGRTVVQTGLLLTPWPLAVVMMAPVAGRLSDRISPGLLGAVGQAMVATGLALVAMLPPHPSDLALIWRLALCGAGFGLFQTPNNRALLQSAPRHRSGGASGMQATARLVGQTAGVALVAAVFAMGAADAPIRCIILAALLALMAAGLSALRIGARTR
jgi:DHA2 family multidrug resistance protein-like MFS transporter